MTNGLAGYDYLNTKISPYQNISVQPMTNALGGLAGYLANQKPMNTSILNFDESTSSRASLGDDLLNLQRQYGNILNTSLDANKPPTSTLVGDSDTNPNPNDVTEDKPPINFIPNLKNIPKTFNQYVPMIIEFANKYGIPPNLAIAVALTESGGNPNAKSPTGVQGLFQVTSNTMKEMGFDPKDRTNPTASAEAGIKYLAQQYQKYGNYDDALTAYNGGHGGVLYSKTGQWDDNSTTYFKKHGIDLNQKSNEVKSYAPKVNSWLNQLNAGNLYE